MSSKSLIYIFIFLVFGHLNAQAQDLKKDSELVFFTDRDYCTSGDTLWFKVWMKKFVENKENVVRVQLDGKGNNLISSVIKKTENGYGRGFIKIPDSLSTGQYFVTAFLNSQRNLSDLALESRSILVYNRFETFVSEIEVVEAENFEKKPIYNAGIKIETDKNDYKTRDKVIVDFTLDSEIKIQYAMVKAAIIDPVTKEYGGNYSFNYKSSKKEIPCIAESDGFLLSGRVIDAGGKTKESVLVLLSIPGEQPYFDYFVSGEEGDFHFYLKDATGSANMVIQAASKNSNEYFIELEQNYLERKDEILTSRRKLNPAQIEFISLMIDGNYYDKIFHSFNAIQPEYFNMPVRFDMPFYGPAIPRRIIPDEFIDLPNFEEISREILNGVHWRKNESRITIKVVNERTNSFFENEPLRLLNGIPIFNNSLLSSLKSNDINYIDIIPIDRRYGDLSFKGILAVSLYDKSNSWIELQPNIFQFNINCFQPESNPDYLSPPKLSRNRPDFRQIYYWEDFKMNSGNMIEFSLSDLKEDVEISIEGFTSDNKYFKTTKTIKVK